MLWNKQRPSSCYNSDTPVYFIVKQFND
jgi:hypothetical protein